jgi:hypothetical protein
MSASPEPSLGRHQRPRPPSPLLGFADQIRTSGVQRNWPGHNLLQRSAASCFLDQRGCCHCPCPHKAMIPRVRRCAVRGLPGALGQKISTEKDVCCGASCWCRRKTDSLMPGFLAMCRSRYRVPSDVGGERLSTTPTFRTESGYQASQESRDHGCSSDTCLEPRFTATRGRCGGAVRRRAGSSLSGRWKFRRSGPRRLCGAPKGKTQDARFPPLDSASPNPRCGVGTTWNFLASFFLVIRTLDCPQSPTKQMAFVESVASR